MIIATSRKATTPELKIAELKTQISYFERDIHSCKRSSFEFKAAAIKQANLQIKEQESILLARKPEPEIVALAAAPAPKKTRRSRKPALDLGRMVDPTFLT